MYVQCLLMDEIKANLFKIVDVISETPRLIHLLITGRVSAIIVTTQQLHVVGQHRDDVLLPPRLAMKPGTGHRMGSPITVPHAVVTTMGLNQLIGSWDAELDAIVTLHASDRRKFQTFRKHHLLKDRRMTFRRLQFSFAIILLKHFALFPTQFARFLRSLIAKWKGGVTDCLNCELGTPGGHELWPSYGSKSERQLFIHIVLVRGNPNIVIGTYIITTCCTQIFLTLAHLFIRFETWQFGRG